MEEERIQVFIGFVGTPHSPRGEKMNLQEKTSEVKHYSNAIKSNFMKIGELLKEIQFKKLYEEKYNSFNQYLLSEEFTFGKVTAYKMIKVYDTFKDVHNLNNINVTTLVEIAYCKDKEIRDDITEDLVNMPENPPLKEIEKFKNKVERSTQRTKEEVEVPIDSLRDKCLRQMKQVNKDLYQYKQLKEKTEFNFKRTVSKLIIFSQRFEDEEVLNEKAKMMKEYEGLHPSTPNEVKE